MELNENNYTEIISKLYSTNIPVKYGTKDLNSLFSCMLAGLAEDGVITESIGLFIKTIFNSFMNEIVNNSDNCDAFLKDFDVYADDALEEECWDIVKAANNVAKKAIDDMN